MPRETFERELSKLQDEILELGSMVEQAILESIQALQKRDLAKSQEIFANDRSINQKRFQIENNCLVLIATQQPMARDLRVVAAVLEINTELERIGDYAKGICRINVLLGDGPLVIPLNDLVEMTEKGLSMLSRALDAFVARDAVAARLIAAEDDQVDFLYNHVIHELMAEMIANPQIIDHANYLVWAAHNLERLADRVTNICERIIFVVTGEMRELDTTDNEKLTR
ncbi:MAG TPA: phosphate signaling complex protein PhoU [Anaerolineales bacterium]